MSSHLPSRLPFVILSSISLLLAPSALAQGYPKTSHELQAITDARKAAADKRSDEIFARNLPEIQAWAAKGKPYLPGAGEPTALPQAKIPSFPGAEGGGMYSFGGRGGKIFVVTTLDDTGPGSFREACEAAGPRIIVFNVSGIIRLKNKIRVRAPYITIAGNTAPGDGVCIAGDTVELEAHDIVIRHMRFRRGALDATDRNDSFGGNPVGNLMIDHVSASWGLDENMSMYRHMYQPPEGGKELKLPTVNVSIQHSIFSEGLNTYHHAFGSTIGGLNSTFHHNLWACNTGRNPSVGMYGDFTFANNVIFNWRHRTVDGGDHRSFFNIINNYYKPGPGTPYKSSLPSAGFETNQTADDPLGVRNTDPLGIRNTVSPIVNPAAMARRNDARQDENGIRYRLLKPESERNKDVKDHFGKAYVNGNIVEGNERITNDNWDGGVQPEVRELPLKTVLASIRVEEPFAHAPITIQTASSAFGFVLANAGATLPRRDAVDQRVLNMVQTGVVAKAEATPEDLALAAAVKYDTKWVKELGELVKLGFITNPAQVGGYPEYKGTPYADTDGDGLPDEWETAHGLNPKDASDATKDLNGDGYTNIEDFINGLDPLAPKTDWSDLKNNVDRRNAAAK